MNFCGLICEFNPFHNGHAYIIQEAKRRTGLDVVCLMSGNFVQRGEPAISSKHERAKNAIEAGAVAVLELPTIYACSNAENFASGAIKIFQALGITTLAFGSENASLEILDSIATLKAENSERFQVAFKNEIENGINYNTALKRSIANSIKTENIKDILDKPNNILAIEYLTAIKKQNAKLEAIVIERIDNGYESRTNKDKFLSASAIRELIYADKDYSKFVPAFVLKNQVLTKKQYDNFENLLLYKLRTSNAKELEKCYDYNEGIEYRVKKCAENFSSIAEIKKNIVSPRYRLARINKLTLYPLLKITKKAISNAKATKPAVRVLAIKKSNLELLSSYNKNKISLVVTFADYKKLSTRQKSIFDIDLHASNIYNIITNKTHNQDIKTGTIFM